MWFSAFDGIYQYDGTNVKRYINIPGDSTSPKREMVKAMAGSDRLWVGYKNGISEFNYNTFAFKKIAIFNGMDILKIVPAPDKNIYVVTKAGLVCYCPKTGETLPLATASDTATFNILKHPFQDMFLKGNKLFMQSGSQIVIYDFRARKAVVIEMNNITLSADRLIVDSKNNFWVTEKNVFKLFRISSDGKQVENMNWLMSP